MNDKELELLNEILSTYKYDDPVDGTQGSRDSLHRPSIGRPHLSAERRLCTSGDTDR